MVTTFGSVSSLNSDYAEIARRPLEADRCALIVVDIQEKLLPPIFQRDQLLKNSQLLIRLAGILKIPALVTTQYAKGLGNTTPEIASLLPDAQPIDKQMFSCFGSDAFCSMLKRLPGNRPPSLPMRLATAIAHRAIDTGDRRLAGRVAWCAGVALATGRSI